MNILLCAGTRPNFVKIAPIYHEAIKRGINVDILHTGQHYDFNLNKIFFKQLRLPNPNINLNIKHTERIEYIEKISNAVERYLKKKVYDFVFVVGDVNSTLGCAKGAKNTNNTIVHVESGLRNNDISMPEEENRIEVDRVADIKFVSEPDGLVNLKKEGLYSTDSCFLVGNVVIDNLINNINCIERSNVLKDFNLDKKSYLLVTLHRPSNVDEKIKLAHILRFLNRVSKDIQIVFPVHPRTKAKIEEYEYFGLLENILVTEPLGYFEYIKLLKNSKFVLTDSGGTQEESTYLKIPCITLRSNTERPITLSKGSSVLVGEDIKLLEYFVKLSMENRLYRGNGYTLWDGTASEKIFDVLEGL